MVQTGVLTPIWYDALEFEAYVIPNNDLDIYILQGEVTETVMLGEASDISQLCEHGSYDWFVFRDEPIQHPDKNLVLGRYLGPAIDVGPEMPGKIMKGKVK